MDHVQDGSTVVTDDFLGYRSMPKIYKHKSVKHCAEEYVRREKDMDVHTNTVESKFSLLKRGIVGTFHQISKKHLPLYLAEFDHRFNHRKDTDGARTVSALKCAEGKRLTLKPLKKGDGRSVRLRIWRDAGSLVFVASDEVFRLLETGQKDVWAIGVPKSDVSSRRNHASK